MRCASPCFYSKSEDSNDRCCNFLGTRAQLVATIVSIVASLLIITGAVVVVILFGSQLGVLYSTIIIGLSVAIGVLLFSVSLRCFTCCALVSRSQHISGNTVRPYINDEKPEETSSDLNRSVEIEENLNDVLLEYAQARSVYQDLVDQKNAVKIQLDTAKEAYESAYLNYQKFEQQCLTDNNVISEELRKSFFVLREKCSEYVRAIHIYEGVLQEISATHYLSGFQRAASMYENIHILSREKETEAQTRIHTLENQLSVRARDIERLSLMEKELRSSLGELQSAHEASKGTIRALQMRLEEVSKTKEDLKNTPFIKIGGEVGQNITQILQPDDLKKIQSLQEENNKLKLTLALYYKTLENINSRKESQNQQVGEDLLIEPLENPEQYTKEQVEIMLSRYFEDERESREKEVASLRERVSQQSSEITSLRSQISKSMYDVTTLETVDMMLEEDITYDMVIDSDEFVDARDHSDFE
ncbi:IncA family protein [Chlamydia sp. 12-01]|uniref:IncA family protein n=1 Tax=Chlamydia sp. 12-01 TaxID=3002742 RepID=UPI0035D41099